MITVITMVREGAVGSGRVMVLRRWRWVWRYRSVAEVVAWVASGVWLVIQG